MVVSDSLDHSKDAVYASNKEIIEYARTEVGEISHVHFIFDGAASQFRTDTLYKTVLMHIQTLVSLLTGVTLRSLMAREL